MCKQPGKVRTALVLSVFSKTRQDKPEEWQAHPTSLLPCHSSSRLRCSCPAAAAGVLVTARTLDQQNSPPSAAAAAGLLCLVRYRPTTLLPCTTTTTQPRPSQVYTRLTYPARVHRLGLEQHNSAVIPLLNPLSDAASESESTQPILLLSPPLHLLPHITITSCAIAVSD